MELMKKIGKIEEDQKSELMKRQDFEIKTQEKLV
jgi:hypothetical protein